MHLQYWIFQTVQDTLRNNNNNNDHKNNKNNKQQTTTTQQSLVKPLFFVKGGDLIALAQCMIRIGAERRVTKVKGHAEDVDVQQGRFGLWINRGMLRLILLLI